MICRICQQEFVIELTFFTLFKRHFICPECLDICQKEPCLDVIPITGGVIEYRSMFSVLTGNFDTMERLYPFYSKPLEIAMSRQEEDTLILFVDQIEYLCCRDWIWLVEGYRVVRFISFIWFDFSLVSEEG
jgi:hypothetical protein